MSVSAAEVEYAKGREEDSRRGDPELHPIGAQIVRQPQEERQGEHQRLCMRSWALAVGSIMSECVVLHTDHTYRNSSERAGVHSITATLAPLAEGDVGVLQRAYAALGAANSTPVTHPQRYMRCCIR